MYRYRVRTRFRALHPVLLPVVMLAHMPDKPDDPLRIPKHRVEDKKFQRPGDTPFETDDGQAVAAVLKVDGRYVRAADLVLWVERGALEIPLHGRQERCFGRAVPVGFKPFGFTSVVVWARLLAR